MSLRSQRSLLASVTTAEWSLLESSGEAGGNVSGRTAA